MRWFWTALVSIFLASPSHARTTFVPLPPGTPFAATIGEGGSATTTAGVDFWTGGAPARKYQLLGFLMEPSEDNLLELVGTTSLAKQVREAGGDALLVVAVADLPAQARIAISTVPGAPKFQFWVIKYLPADAYAISPSDHAGQLAEMRKWTEEQCTDSASITSMARLSPDERKAIRAEIRNTISRIARQMLSEPEDVRRRNEEIQRLTMQMLDCQEQRQVALATDAAIRGGVGTEINWTSATHPAVSGRSIASAQETLGDGTHCLTVTDIIIVDGEETVAEKRMCRLAGKSSYEKA